ncbi:MAG: pyridoxamine 5'-phosphate oxidase family protein [Actinomycetota bacterium]|nr:pyridoxamine 5'-phosphate oxidase family protein [Actinomycetota bacterium]
MKGVDDADLEIIDEPECLDLLADAEIGRVGVTIDALPAIRTVLYRPLDGQVTFLVRENTKLAAALSNRVVAFEADWTDPITHAGWTVHLVGIARLSPKPTDPAAVEAAFLRQRPGAGPARLVTVCQALITGRRLPAVPRQHEIQEWAP